MDRFWERYIQSRPAPGESKGAFEAFAAEHRDPGPRIGLDTGGPLTMDMLNSFTKIKEFDQAWQQYKRGGGKWGKGTFFKAWAPENMAHGGSAGQLVQNTADGSRPGYGGGYIKKILMSLIETGQTKFKDMSALKNKIKEITGKKPGGSFQKSQVDYKPLLEKFSFEKFIIKKPKQITGITKISDELAAKIKNVGIKSVNVSPDTTKTGQKSIKVTIQDPEVRGEFFGKNKTQVFPANEEGLAQVQKLVDNIFTSNIYTLKVKPFKTPEYFRKLRRLKEARYSEQDPFGIYKALQKYKTKKFPGSMSSDIQIQHGQPKFTTQTLSRWGLIPKHVQTIEAVERAERLRNELLSKTLIKLKKPNRSLADKQIIIDEANSAFTGLKNQLKGTEGQGLVNFELLKLDEMGNVAKLKDVGFNPNKGLAYGDELGELDLAKITKEQADQIVALGKEKIDLELLRKVLPSKLKDIVNPTPLSRHYESGGRVGLSAGGWLVSFFGPEAIAFEFAYYEAARRNFLSKGYSEEEAKAMAIDEASWGITSKGDKAYNKELEKVAKEMGLDSKAFDTIREISKRNKKTESELKRDKDLLDSGYFQTEESKNEFLDKRDKLYGNYNKETERLWRKAKTEIGMDKAGKVFPTPNLDQISMESMNVRDADVQTSFEDLQKVAKEKLRRRKSKAYDVQSKQADPEGGSTFRPITNWFTGTKDFFDLRTKGQEEQRLIDDMVKVDPRELYRYNIARGLHPDKPVSEGSLKALSDRYPDLRLVEKREGGIASLNVKK